jgi:RNA polymerase sigma-70 factor, ECF subfamily
VTPSPDPDVELMLRLQGGDHAALSLLLERNHARVLNLAFRYLRDRAAAEDVVQETFLRVFKARERYQPSAKFRTWLLRIATNVCLSQLRRKRPLSLDGGAEAEDGAVDPLDPDAPQPGQGTMDRELKGVVRDAVAQLPERQRIAIVLNKFEGLDYKQVAEQLDLTVPATKSLLHRARMALKDVLQEYLEGPP